MQYYFGSEIGCITDAPRTEQLVHKDGTCSVMLVAVQGLGSLVVNERSTSRYSLVHGSGYVEVSGRPYNLVTGEDVVIPAGEPYRDNGQMVIMVTSEPPYDSADVRVL